MTTDERATPIRAERGLRPGLVVSGLLLLLAPFLYANPFLGIHRNVWPWDVWLESRSWDARTEMAGIALVGVLATICGFGRGRIRLLAIVAGLASFFAIRLHGEAATFSLLSVERLGLTWFASGASLGVGLLLLARRDGVARTLGVTLVLLGVVWTLTFLCAWFPRDPVAAGRSMAAFYVWRIAMYWNALVLGGEVDAATRATLMPTVWGQVIPTIFLGLAVLLALAAALRAASARARAGTRLAAAAFAAYLGTWLIPFVSTLLLGIDDPEFGGVKGVIATLGNALLDAGLALWLVLVFSLAPLAGALSSASPARALGPARAVAARAPFAVAFALGVVSLFAHFHPREGFAARAWPSEVARSFEWTAAGSSLVFHVAFLCLAFTAFVVRSPRAGLYVLAAGFGAALVALEGPIRDELSARRFLFRAPAYVPFLLAAIATATTAVAGARDRPGNGAAVGRIVGLFAALTLVGLIVYPVSLPTAPKAGPADVGVVPYSSVLSVGWNWARSADRTPIDFWLGFEPRYGCPLLTTLLVSIGLLAALGAVRRPGRARRVAAWSLFVLASVWPIVQLAADAFRSLGGTLSAPLRVASVVVASSIRFRCAGAVAFFYLPAAWAAAGLLLGAGRLAEESSATPAVRRAGGLGVRS